MINTKISSQIATQRTDIKSDVNVSKDKEKLSPNELLTQNLRQKLGLNKQYVSPNEVLQKFAQDEINQKLQEIVNKLLSQINAHKNPNSPILKQANLLNFAPNFVNELKLLSKELSKNEAFAPLLSKIEMLLKPASEMQAKDLAPLLKNSGVFFEAKLKNALNEELLPKSFHQLINSIKSLSSDKIATQIASLADKNLSPKESLKELAHIIMQNKGENKVVVNHSLFKPLLELSQKLDNFKKYINKNPQLAESKITSLAQNFSKELSKIKEDFVKILTKPENLLAKDTVPIKQAIQAFEKLQKHLDKITQNHTANEQKPNLNSKDLLKDLFEIPKEEGKIELKDEKAPLQKQDNEEQKIPQKEKLEDSEEIQKEESLNDKDTPKDNEVQKEEPKENENFDRMEENLEEDLTKESLDSQENPNEQIKDEVSESFKETIKENSKEVLKESIKENIKEGTKKESIKDLPKELAKEGVKMHEEKAFGGGQVKTQEGIFKQQEFSKEVFKNLAFKAVQGENLEELESLSKDISTLNRKINESLRQLDPAAQNAKINLSELKTLENKLINSIKDLQNIKLKNAQDINYEIQNDVKSTLLQVASQAKSEGNDAVYNQANKILAQIEMNQLMSLANDSINTYLPFSWDDLNESKIVFRRGKKDKFFAQIKLEFAKLGELEVLVSLNNEKYIDINIMAENKEFRKLIYENAHELKRNINKAGLLSSNFFVGDIIRSKFDPRDLRNYDLQMGMDKKV